MRYVLIVALSALAAALSTSGSALAESPTTAVQPPSSPTHLLVYAQEWSLWPSRGSVPTGRVMVELWNRGDDAHDLRIRRLDSADQMVGRVLGAVRTTASGGLARATWRLPTPGRYQLYCSVPGHLALGMKAELTVTRARR